MAEKQRRTKDKDERIDEILDAAKTVFFNKGYFNSTVEEISKLAGISKGTVYLYFKNKDELYVSLIMPMIEEYARLLLEFESKLVKNEFKTGDDIIMEFYNIYCKLYEYDTEGLRIFQVYLSTNLFSAMPKNTRDRLWLSGKRNIRIMKGIITDSIK